MKQTNFSPEQIFKMAYPGEQDSAEEKLLFQSYIDNQSEKTPLPVRIMTMVGAWISSMLLTVFLFLIEAFKDEVAAFYEGIILIAAALLISGKVKRMAFLEPFSISMGLVGQGLFVYGILEITDSLSITCFAVMVLQVCVFMFSTNGLQHFLSVIFIQIALYILLLDTKINELIHLHISILALSFSGLLIYEMELVSKLKDWNERYFPVVYGCLISFVFLLGISVNKEFLEIKYWWVSSGIIFLVITFVLVAVLKELKIIRERWFLLVFLAVVLAPMFNAPGIFAGMLIMVLGFYKRLPVVLGIGIFAMVFFFIAFYYNLEMTLLWKSIVLMGSGTLLLLARFGLRKFNWI